MVTLADKVDAEPAKKRKATGWTSSEFTGSAASSGVLGAVALSDGSPSSVRIAAICGLTLVSLGYCVSRTFVKAPWSNLASLSMGSALRRVLSAWSAKVSTSTPSRTPEKL